MKTIIWTLRDGIARRELQEYDTTAEAHAVLRALEVPALAMCDGVSVGASGVTRPAHVATIRAAFPTSPKKRRGGARDIGLTCSVCGAKAAPSQERLPALLAALCADDRATAQTLRSGKARLSAEEAVARLVARRQVRAA